MLLYYRSTKLVLSGGNCVAAVCTGLVKQIVSNVTIQKIDRNYQTCLIYFNVMLWTQHIERQKTSLLSEFRYKYIYILLSIVTGNHTEMGKISGIPLFMKVVGFNQTNPYTTKTRSLLVITVGLYSTVWTSFSFSLKFFHFFNCICLLQYICSVNLLR